MINEDNQLLARIHDLLNESGYEVALGFFSEVRLHHIIAILVHLKRYNDIPEIARLYPEGKSLNALIEYGTYPQEIETVRHLKFLFLS